MTALAQGKYKYSHYLTRRITQSTEEKVQLIMHKREKLVSLHKEESPWPSSISAVAVGDVLGLQIHLLLPKWLSITSSVEAPRVVWPTAEQVKFFQHSVVELLTDREWRKILTTQHSLIWVYHNTGKQNTSMLLRYQFSTVLRIWGGHTVIVWMPTLHLAPHFLWQAGSLLDCRCKWTLGCCMNLFFFLI